MPTVRGRFSSFSAVSSSIVSGDIDLNSDARRGLGAAAFFVVFFFGASVTSPVAGSASGSSGSVSSRYGPKRPSFTTTTLPLSGFSPSTRLPATGASTSSCTFSGVSSSGASSSGTLMRRGSASGFSGSVTSRYGPYLAEPQRGGVGDRRRVQLAGVDLAEVVNDSAQARVLVAAVVEALQPLGPVGLAARDAVEVLLELGGEVVIDELAEVAFEQADHAEREPRRHERLTALGDIPAIEDHADDARERRGAADAALRAP